MAREGSSKSALSPAYSTIWLARALPADGRLITLEFEARHAEVARENLKRAGLADKVEVRLGRAIDNLPKLLAEGAGPFDFIFIDADKPSYPDYLDWALKLSRPGTVIIADNVVRDGKITDKNSDDELVRGVQALQRKARGREARGRGRAADRRQQGIRRLRVGSRQIEEQNACRGLTRMNADLNYLFRFPLCLCASVVGFSFRIHLIRC
jgi:Predicted O-methyltransferase